jgi:hypothetical protein
MGVWCVCMRLFCVCVALCLGRGLATSWSLVQGVLLSVEKWLRNRIRGQGPEWAGTHNDLWSKKWFRFQSNVLEVNCIWESISQCLCAAFYDETSVGIGICSNILHDMHPVVYYLRKDIIWYSRTTNNVQTEQLQHSSNIHHGDLHTYIISNSNIPVRV